MAVTDDLEAALDRFEERVVGRDLGEGSYRLYENWIRRFEAWLAHTDRADPNIGTLEDFDNFLVSEDRTDYPWENGQGRPAPNSYAYQTRVLAVSAVKKWVRREYDTFIPDNPKSICLGEPAPFDPTYLDPGVIEETIAKAPEACPVEGCEVALRLSYDAILRAKELTRVREGDIDWADGTIYVRAVKKSQNADVGLAEETVEALQEFADDHSGRERLFQNSYGRSWDPSSWATHVRRKHHGAGSHAIGRHSPIMHRLERPSMFPDMEPQDVFGQVYRRARHSNPSMTARYARRVGVDIPEWAGDE